MSYVDGLLTISEGNSIPLGIVDTIDEQTLSIEGDTIAISNGNSIQLPLLQGLQGVQGSAGDPASDDQTLSYLGGTQLLTIAGGNSVNLSGLLDNTDTLADLSCASGQVAQWSGASSTWVCGTASGVNTDDQTLSLTGSTLNIVDGNSISL